MLRGKIAEFIRCLQILRARCFDMAIGSGKNVVIAKKDNIQMISKKVLHGCAYVKQAKILSGNSALVSRLDRQPI
jgi:hypothetical protein